MNTCILKPAKQIGFFFIVFILYLNAYPGDSTNIKLPVNVYGKIFSNYHSQISNGDNPSGFEIKRAYFGYKAKMSKHFEANIKLDIGSPEDLSEFSLIRRYAYFKNAYVKYKNKKLTSIFGILDVLHFKMQEDFWKHRYIEKSFADIYRFGVKADLGWQIEYQWLEWLTTDFTIMNGEGYTQLQNDNTLKAGFGASFYPFKNFVTRVYYDLSMKTTTQSTMALFFGYELKDKVIIGIEGNYKLNDDYRSEYDRYGYSVYASYYVFKKWQLFGRFDRVNSNILENEEYPWNLAKDGSKIIGGIEYSPIKNLKIALNYQDWYPYAENETNDQYLFLNLEIVF
jgi:hypothetical protein